LDPAEIVRRRLHQQRLTGEPFATPAQAVAWSGAMQAQEYAEAQWSLGLRVRDSSAADVETACDRGEILRTHVMRPTWHFVTRADLRWLLRLTGSRVKAKGAGRRRELGLDPDTLALIERTLVRVLSDGEPRTRDELAAVLDRAGIRATGPRLSHALMHAELGGLVCSGPRRGRHHTYLPLDGRVPAAPVRSREEDVTELVTRYFVSHGPATLRDFAWWSGLTVADARAGVVAAGDRLALEEDEDGTPWVSAGAPVGGAAPRLSGAFLLGTYDETVVAYRDLRSVRRDGRPSDELPARPIVFDGRTVGSWTRRLAPRELTIEATLDRPSSRRQNAALRRAADRFGAFVGLPAKLELRTV
jgi:hypothetical protein